MSSSMLAGERRWASARRGGMTVLGKVAVPKPLNLPSQKLENHGLDPNVEIVPKGTLSWGSRPSSSGSNPWISSSVSPNAEGGTVSPSHLSGRPSSGGSGTRPSTAGSERTHEAVSSAWGSNSRPSSASGTLSSNQTSSTSLRPKSAENRPNSSQLSRFADPVLKNSAVLCPSATAERLGVKSNKDDAFALSSGDFPTLGSEKDNSMKNTKLEDTKHGAVDTWRADGPRGVDDDIHPRMEKWHGENPPHFNPNASAPQHFNTWRGPPPMNNPAGVWYGGGRPQGPPYGAPTVRPGGFPMEPFPFYRPQIAPPPLAGSQPGPTSGLRGPYPKNGDLYRPQMPDAYAHPGMPFRPGFYPGPPGPPGPMGFEGYYGPPMGYEREIPYMGMAVGPPVHNSSYPAPHVGNSHGRNGLGVHPGKTSSKQGDADRVEDTQGPKRIQMKSHPNQRDHWRDEKETREHNAQPDVSYTDKNRPHMISSRKNEWGADEDTEQSVHSMTRTRSEKPSQSEYREHAMDGIKVKPFEGKNNSKAVHDNWTNASDSAPSFPAEMPRIILGSEKDPSLLSGSKHSALMHKIDGLNVKVRVADGRNVSPRTHNRGDERNRSQVSDTKINNNLAEVGRSVGSLERTTASRDFASSPHEIAVPVIDKPLEQVTVTSRRPHHGGQGRVDHRGKGKSYNQDSDGWRRKPLTTESSSVTTSSHDESEAHGPDNVEEVVENSVGNPLRKIEKASADSHDSSDIQVQRAKMREIAKQRALQLQKEEEERIREQRAKALAKLEELNRRTLADEAGTETETETSNKVQKAINDNLLGEQDESCAACEVIMDDVNNSNQAKESTVEMSRTSPVESDVTTFPMHEDACDVSVPKDSPQFNDGGISRNKVTSFKQKHSLRKSFAGKPVSNVAMKAPEDHIHVATNDIKPDEHPSEIKSSESNMPNTEESVAEPSMPQRRKNNRSGKNKQKLDGAPLPPVEANVIPGKESKKVETKGSLSNSDSLISKSTEPDKAVEAQERSSSSLPNEESHNRISCQWRPHSSRRQPRNQQQPNNKPHGCDAVWAPVRPQNKAAKGSAEASSDSVQESADPTNGNNHMTQNNSKGKRAEMERYVPKPVAKELAQQGSVLNIPPSIAFARSKDGSNGEVNEGGVNHNKHKKDHGTWKQRGPTDSSHMKGGHIGPSSTYDPVKEIQEPKEIGLSVKGEIDSANAETRTSGTSRGKRNVARGPATIIGNNTDPEITFSGEVDANQTDRTIGSKENRASSRWQPKPTVNAANNQSLITEINRFSKKEQHSQPKEQSGNSNQTQPGQPVNPASKVEVSTGVGHRQQSHKKAKGRPYSPNQDPMGPREPLPLAAGNENVPVERNFGSGSRRNGRHNNNRSIRGHDNNNARGEWISGHDNRPHNTPSFRDNRQRHNTHYEYQPVGPFKGNNRPEKVDVPVDGADSTYQKHRERGSGQPRRGERQSGYPSHVDSGWE